jgi:hypothetical protein
MQISQPPILSDPGFVRQPQPGSRQQVTTELQVKALAQGGPEAAKPAARGAAVATAGSLDEAVRALADSGRLPRRGSLIDIKA